MMPAAPRKRAGSMQPKGEATILLFLGVRYVRSDEGDEDAAPPPMPLDQTQSPMLTSMSVGAS